MNRLVLLAAMLLSPGISAAECYSGSADAILVKDWSVEIKSEATHTIALTLESTLPKPIRMANVDVRFVDVLGNEIGGFAFEPDFSIKPKEIVHYSRDIGSMLMPRLPNLKQGDATPLFCTRAVLYDDGTKEEF
jgi:hypothetical protein